MQDSRIWRIRRFGGFAGLRRREKWVIEGIKDSDWSGIPVKWVSGFEDLLNWSEFETESRTALSIELE